MKSKVNQEKKSVTVKENLEKDKYMLSKKRKEVKN